MVAKILVGLLLISLACEAEQVSKRYLSIYATDITTTVPHLEQIRGTLKDFIVATRNNDLNLLKKVTTSQMLELFEANKNVSASRAVDPTKIKIQDLAVYQFKKRIFAQFDINDLNHVESLNTWFELEPSKGSYKILAIHNEFDPDSGP